MLHWPYTPALELKPPLVPFEHVTQEPYRGGGGGGRQGILYYNGQAGKRRGAHFETITEPLAEVPYRSSLSEKLLAETRIAIL